MLTIFAFINFVGSIFNCASCISIFSSIDEIHYKPEKSTQVSNVLAKYFPLEFIVLSFNMGTAVTHKHWFQFIILLPIMLYNSYM